MYAACMYVCMYACKIIMYFEEAIFENQLTQHPASSCHYLKPKSRYALRCFAGLLGPEAGGHLPDDVEIQSKLIIELLSECILMATNSTSWEMNMARDISRIPSWIGTRYHLGFSMFQVSATLGLKVLPPRWPEEEHPSRRSKRWFWSPVEWSWVHFHHVASYGHHSISLIHTILCPVLPRYSIVECWERKAIVLPSFDSYTTTDMFVFSHFLGPWGSKFQIFRGNTVSIYTDDEVEIRRLHSLGQWHPMSPLSPGGCCSGDPCSDVSAGKSPSWATLPVPVSNEAGVINSCVYFLKTDTAQPVFESSCWSCMYCSCFRYLECLHQQKCG